MLALFLELNIPTFFGFFSPPPEPERDPRDTALFSRERVPFLARVSPFSSLDLFRSARDTALKPLKEYE